MWRQFFIDLLSGVLAALLATIAVYYLDPEGFQVFILKMIHMWQEFTDPNTLPRGIEI